MTSSGHRYRIRSPLNSPRAEASQPPLPPVSDVGVLPPVLYSSDVGSDTDSDTVIFDSGCDGSSTPNSRETSVPPSRDNNLRFAGLQDEALPDQSIAATIPYEIILNVFRFLEPVGNDHYNCLFVCKAWTKCAVESVWFRPSIKNIATYLKFAVNLSPATRKGPALFPYAHFVRRMNLLNVARDLTPKHFAMLEGCTQLERLTMGGATHITDSAIQAVVPNFKRLLALDVSQTDLGDEGLCAVAEACKLMQGLNVSLCPKLTNLSITAIAENCPDLRRVKLAGLPKITDASVGLLVENSRLLLELDLSNCGSVTGEFLPKGAVVNAHPAAYEANHSFAVHYLRELRLGACASFNTHIFLPRFVTHNWVALRILDLTQCTRLSDSDLIIIVYNAPRIRNLVLYKCANLTDRGIEALTALGKYLHYLHLGHCMEITDASVIKLARHCTRLRYLDLASCLRITDVSCLELGLHLEKLKRIGLVKCVNVSDAGLITLVRGRARICEVLERIHLSYCYKLTRESITTILPYCPKLTHISLSAIPAFLRPEIQELRRPVPADFTPEQRNTFAVFSGSGVARLKNALYRIAHQEEGSEDAEF